MYSVVKETLCLCISACPENYTLVGERCYRVFTAESDWYTASANCSQDGAMLVSLQTQEEERALREFLQTKYGRSLFPMQYAHLEPLEVKFMY